VAIVKFDLDSDIPAEVVSVALVDSDIVSARQVMVANLHLGRSC
jgi:hypothetical protein